MAKDDSEDPNEELLP